MKSPVALFLFILISSIACIMPGLGTPAVYPTIGTDEIPTMIALTMRAIKLSETSEPPHTPTPINTGTPTPTITHTPTQATCPETNESYDLYVVELINEERTKAGLPPLAYQIQLTWAAQLHSADMACNNHFSNTDFDGSDLAELVMRRGYVSRFLGENIAAGYKTPEETVNNWMNSPDHKANILAAGYTEVGAGYAYSSNSDYGTYWTVIFGSP